MNYARAGFKKVEDSEEARLFFHTFAPDYDKNYNRFHG